MVYPIIVGVSKMFIRIERDIQLLLNIKLEKNTSYNDGLKSTTIGY
jgi:hypothetical protein